ncbi:MAG: hypothetical protein OEQ28_06060 [Acidobacteriota bacterium]|nr:hypothetical protein [Acidobacteriota bacterium]
MNGVKRATHLAEFLRYFSDINEMRPTRMGVFENGPRAVTDYWLEDGLPLVGVDVDQHDADKMSVIIMLSNKEESESSHFSHVIKNVRMVKFNLSHDGLSDGLDILDFDGKTTVLSFENR